MPFVKTGSKLIYYAHIPKCAGSSVEHYLKERFGPIALLDSNHGRLPEEYRWSKTSPQHIDYAAAERFLPRAMFDSAFAIVRHPVKRLVSVFKFQRDVEKLIPPDEEFKNWLRWVKTNKGDLRFRYDNHLLPQVEFLPKQCTLFHLEHGLTPLIPYFDAIVGKQDGPAEFERVNESSSNANHHQSGDSRPITPSAEELSMIYEIYEDDFKKLGYDLSEAKPLKNAPKVASVSSSYRHRPISAPRRFIADGLKALLGIVEHP